MTEVYKYNRSFSGTDTLAFILLPGCNPIVLGSITTISYSMFRNKKPVINIGRTNINGVTRGSRVFAGSMVFTLINQHWVKDVLAQDTCKDWLGKFSDLKVDELPLFDIMIISANEYGAYCSMFIYGIDVTDEAQTISVEDLFTENVFQFVARDLTTFKGRIPKEAGSSGTANKNEGLPSSLVDGTRAYMLSSDASTIADLDRYIRERKEKADNILRENKMREALIDYPFTRTLQLNSLRPMIGQDVTKVQESLNKILKPESRIAITGVYDKETERAVREWQSLNNRNITGNVDIRDYLAIINEADDDAGLNMYAAIINKTGAYSYALPDSTSSVSYTYPYKENVIVHGTVMGTDGYRYYITDTGYVRTGDMYTAEYKNAVSTFPILREGSNSSYVILLKNALEAVTSFTFDGTSEFSTDVTDAVKAYQKLKGLDETGEVDQDLWKMLQAEIGDINVHEENDITITFSPISMPGDYTIKDKGMLQTLDDMAVKIESKNKTTNIKYTGVTRYKNNKYSTISSIEALNGSTTVKMSKFLQSFLYDPENGEVDTVEVTIFAEDTDAYKWFFTLEN